MKGDLTRGHRPDAKRKEKYRRVLLQEGRLVLDSDVAAGADAVDTLLRDLASDVGCENGSPNLGYLVTPGPLLAAFETLDGVTLPAPGGTFVAYRDYGAKYHERFPSIYVDAHATGGFVHIRARRKLDKTRYSRVRLWLRANASVEVKIHGSKAVPIAATDAATFKPYDVLVPANAPKDYDVIEVGFSAAGASNEVWIGLIEGYEAAAKAPLFSYTRGRYYLRGLAVESANDGIFWESTFPASKGFASADMAPPVGSYVAAYLEGWERLVTHIEDGGILEQALGGVLDTTVRSKAIGQVKLALFANDGSHPLKGMDDVPAAFENVDAGTGKLKLTTKVTPDNLDPCAIPEAGGYTGADNRFYRFEVHTGGALGTVEIKWSKNNGADAFAVAAVADTLTSLTLAPGAEVKDGDLIELVDETDELGDSAPAQIALGTKSFRAAQRLAGQLFYAETTATSSQIKLRDRVTKLSVNVPTDFAAKSMAPRKVRVWHGLLVTKPEAPADPPVTAFDLGDGITIALSGAAFRPGDYWQHEARKIKDNQNGPWQESPHGPERLFAPLALFQYNGESAPLLLVRWYDHQYSAICELNADDIAYDGGKAGTTADTVQEALDELYEREDGGCCDVSLSPSGTHGDDTARLQEAIDEAVAGGTICLKRGIYRVYGTLKVVEKRVIIAGCPHATILGSGGESASPVFHVEGTACLTLRDLLVFARGNVGPLAQLELSGDNPDGEGRGDYIPTQLRLERTALVNPADNGIAIRVAEPDLPVINPEDATPFRAYPDVIGGASIHAEDSIILGVWGILAEYLAASDLVESVVLCEKAGIYAKGASSLQLRGSSIQGWLGSAHRQTLAEAEDEDLETVLTNLVETGAGYAYTGGSIGVVVGRLAYSQSVFERCSFSCGTPVFIGYVYDLVSTGNDYVAGSGACVRLDYIHQCRMSGDRFYSYGPAAIWVPWEAMQMLVDGCFFEGARGVLLAASSSGSSLPPMEDAYPWLHRVRIHNSHFSTYILGVQIGPSIDMADEGSSPPVVSMEGVEVTANSIGYTYVGVACTLLDPPPWNDGAVRSSRLRIAGNKIDAGVGVLALGNDVVVQGNTLHAQFASSPEDNVLGLPMLGASLIGIYLSDGGRLAVQENVIDLPTASPAAEGGSVGILLYERWSEGDRDDIVVQDNTVSASAPFWAAGGETGAGTSGLLLEANRFTGLGSRGQQLFGCTVRGNVFAGGLTIESGSDNIVSSNRLSASLGSYVALEISHAQGSWQVQDNRADGSILLTPITFPYTGAADKYQQFIELWMFWMDPENGGGTGTLPFERAQVLFQGYLKALGVDSVDKEFEYHAQVEGNWATLDLAVGRSNSLFRTPYGTYPASLPDMDSALQIVANRAGHAFVTNMYGRIVFAHNFAAEYNIQGWSQTGPITTPNFNVP
jgi:hypothetical protein